MKIGFRVVLALAVALGAQSALAFDTQTHALMTRVAYQRSTIPRADGETLASRLGWDRLSENNRFQMFWSADNRARYYKDGDRSERVSFPSSFEKCQMRDFLNLGLRRRSFKSYFQGTVESQGNSGLLPIQNWLVSGAIREDDMGDNVVGWWPLLSAQCRWEWFNTVSDQPGLITRSFRHFYDPESDKGLSVLGLPYPKSVNWALGNEDSFIPHAVPAEGSARSTYSYLDARNAYWWALTRKRSSETGFPDNSVNRELDSEDRMILWATMFRSLGNVVHLLQDAAQPQHTRLDKHSGIDPDQNQAFEGYTNARILGRGDVGSFVRGFFSKDLGDELSIPPLGNYNQGAPVIFSTPLRFFTTRSTVGGPETSFLDRAGIADYSNRGFFTGGTLPDSNYPFSNGHQSPPEDYEDPANGYTLVGTPCESIYELDSRLQSAICDHYVRKVADSVDSSYASFSDELPPGFSRPYAPILAEGLFRDYEGVFGRVSWSPAVLDTIGNLTIPRAIGYSAGMLNFFFRGEIKVSSPPEGLYAVVDQGAPHHVEEGIPMDETGHVFGFKKLRVGIRNVTMVANGADTLRDAGSGMIVPQRMRSGLDASGNTTGRLVAIARYHRNPCYRPDLSGEYVVMPFSISGVPNLTDIRIPNGCSVADARTAFQEISVSTSLSLDSSGNLPGPPVGTTNPCLNNGNINTGTYGVGAGCDGESVLAEFDFSEDPIPINATDLFLQVAYRGPLGLEDDGIAVGMKDIDEANYISMWNGTDWFYRSGEWVPPEHFPELPLGVDWEAKPINEATVCVGNQTIAVLSPGQAMQPTEFIRVGVLSDASTVPFGIATVVGRYSQYYPLSASRGFRQSLMEDATSAPYNPWPFLWYARGTTMGGNFLGPFFAYGDAPEDNIMQSMVLHPWIGGASPGIARPIHAGLEVDMTSCQPRLP